MAYEMALGLLPSVPSRGVQCVPLGQSIAEQLSRGHMFWVVFLLGCSFFIEHRLIHIYLFVLAITRPK